MGFPVRANIFRTDSAPNHYFRRFPIQVAVLFSPHDETFAPAFRDIFLYLDQLTGERVAFFAVLDPPQDWQAAAANRAWWQEQKARVGELGFSFDERPLVSEIARRFGVEWWEMPVIVVSPNLWAAEYVVAPTSAADIEPQLTALTDLVREWGRPDINPIMELFEDELGTETRFVPANFSKRNAFFDFYDVLGSYDPERQQLHDRSAFEHHVRQAARQAATRNSPLAFGRSGEEDPAFQQETVLFDQVASEVAGQLVPVATVAERVYRRLTEPRLEDLLQTLEETSLAMIETSLTVGQFLEAIEKGILPGFPRLRFDARARDRPQRELDFSPGAMGIWKMLELETNHSLIQAGRKACGIRMPDYFMRHDPDCPKEVTIVVTGTRRNGDPYKTDLNRLDRQHRPRHQMVTLGTGWHVVDSLNEPGSVFDDIVRGILGQELPKIVMDDWTAVRSIRNRASHVAAISFKEYQKVLNMGLNGKFLDPLVQIKQAMMSPSA